MATAARMWRLQLTLAKALDVSMSQAAAASLRDALEAQCEEDPALLEQFFPRAEDAEELSAHTLLSLRQKIESAFEKLCEKYDVNAKLLELEQLVQQAEEAKLRAIAREDKYASEFNSCEINEEEENAEAAKDQDEATPASIHASPDAIVRMERLRVMEQEKYDLQLLLVRENTEVELLEASVGDLRRSALEQVEHLQAIAMEVDSTRQLVKDYASRS